MGCLPDEILLLIGHWCEPTEKKLLAEALRWEVSEFIGKLNASRYKPLIGKIRQHENVDGDWAIRVSFRLDFYLYLYPDMVWYRVIQKTEQGSCCFEDRLENVVTVYAPYLDWSYYRHNVSRYDLNRSQRILKDGSPLP